MIPHVESKAEFEDVDLQYDKDKTKQIKWHHQILLNRPLKVVIALILAGVLSPLLLYQFVFYAGLDVTSPDGFSLGSCLVPRSSRLPCGLGNVTAAECHQQCCYDHNNNLCFHRFPSRFSYILDRHWTEAVNLKPRVATVPFKSQNSLTNIRLSLDEVSSTHLTITFYNSAEFSLTGRRIEEKEYVYQIDSPELNIVVNSTGRTVFNTVRGPLIASDNIWEISFKLTDESMYGFGEIPIKENTVKMIHNHRGGLSSIPLIYAKVNGSYHGLLIDTVDPTEVSFREDNVMVIRSLTNFGLKFHVFVGPKPFDVMRDVREFIGFSKDIEYWMLGAHICSEYSDEEKSTTMRDYIQSATTQNMPFESHCVKPIVFDNLCETEPVTNINNGATLLRNAGKKFVPHVSPHIIYYYNEVNETDSTEFNETEILQEFISKCSFDIEDYKDFMLQNSELTGVYIGQVGSKEVVYPDYRNATLEFMQNVWLYTTDFGAVILDNNWPLDESDKMINETNLFLPYFSENFEEAFYHTPPWNAKYVSGEKHLHRHNEYGNDFSRAFELMNVETIGVPSQCMNGNVYIHRQNVPTSWTNLNNELIQAALGGISGHWHWSSPICGDTDNFDPEVHTSLCVKWYLAATYLPMITIRSKETGRDPLSFTGTHRNLMINALRNRLALAPYFYSTLQEGPLLRPMFFQYPESDKLRDLTTQFSVGNDLLIGPNLQPSQSMVHVYMPPGVWYELWSGLKIDAEEGQAVTMATTEADFLTLIRGGSIVAMQMDVKLTAEATRSQSNFKLTIALHCESFNITEIERTNTTKCRAAGSLHLSSNTSINFEADGEKLRITADGDYSVFCGATAPTWARWITDINVYGLEDTINNYDHMKYVVTSIDLCALETDDEIVFDFVT